MEMRDRFKQGRTHGSPVAGGWAGAVMAVRTLNSKVGPTNRPTQWLIRRVARDKKNPLHFPR